jgi:hypothetical protein
MSKKRFDEQWLAEYQRRTGCKATQTGGQRRAPAVRDEASRQPNEPRSASSAVPGAQPGDYGELRTGTAPQEGGKRPRKYGNEPVEAEGQRFDSRHEARVYERLRLEGLAGAHIGLARQVTFFLPGGIRYIADFVTLHRDGGYRVIDAKSEGTRKNPVYRLKKRQMKNCLGLDIEEA